FDKDANRGFTYTLEKSTLSTSFIINKDTKNSHVTSDEYKNNPRVQQARNVMDTLAKTIFPNEDADHTAARAKLGNTLRGISHQALFASPMTAFRNHPPSDGTCLIQGTVSNANFSYSITDPSREIMINATATYDNATLIGAVMNDEKQLEARPLGFPKDGHSNSTGKISGSVSLNIIATVGDDGNISELRCASLNTSWDVNQNTPETPAIAIA
ncbi:MAG: hypothetical protein WCO92_04095, partial [Verrucomicrobiota bacterium]